MDARPTKTRIRIATAPAAVLVVHNGIIENYLALKQELQAQGHEFRTQTDTEVVAHLIERDARSAKASAERLMLQPSVRHRVRVRRALTLMRGLFALVIISARRSGQDRRRPQRPADRRRRGR